MTRTFQSPNGVQIALVQDHGNSRRRGVSITKRCTDCFRPTAWVDISLTVSITKRCTDCFCEKKYWRHPPNVSITKRCTDCFSAHLSSASAREQFQSPNGVQIALSTVKLLQTFLTQVSITKRCTDCFIKSDLHWISKLSFNHQTVYRLLSLRLNLVQMQARFQSPNGVQIALGIVRRWTRSVTVSITKRCTDCFR